jgi:PIN domain nuclease of toxin-antitoxin system
VILDTCALLWLAEGGQRLSRRTFQAVQSSPELRVSAISAFEVALKVNTGQLTLPAPVTEWFDTVVANHGLTVLDLDQATCIRAAGLPMLHRDPCDRFIIAAAKIHGCEVVTSDSRFAEYGLTTLI